MNEFDVINPDEAALPPLPREDWLTLQAVEGWLLLGNPHEALQQLECLSVDHGRHPVSLAVMWEVFVCTRAFEEAWLASVALCEVCPDLPQSWICQANSLRYMQDPARARLILLSAAQRFPGDAAIAYNLACATCQLGRCEEAVHWLGQAFTGPEAPLFRVMATTDPDLRALREAKLDFSIVGSASAETELENATRN